MNICILDNFDSFTFNLLDEFSGPKNHVHVWRNTMSASDVTARLLALSPPRLLVLSPGPGHPSSAGSMIELITSLQGQVPIFGVCLGMQAIVTAFGGLVEKAQSVVHGKARILTHDQSLIFQGLPERVMVGRYHSLAALKVPPHLRVFGECEGLVMAVHHVEHPIIGIQFHPESILTTYGSVMIQNTLSWAMSYERI
jgi:anthranilate synthase component 2